MKALKLLTIAAAMLLSQTALSETITCETRGNDILTPAKREIGSLYGSSEGFQIYCDGIKGSFQLAKPNVARRFDNDLNMRKPRIYGGTVSLTVKRHSEKLVEVIDYRWIKPDCSLVDCATGKPIKKGKK